MQTFWNALSGMVAAQTGLNMTAANIANEATTGYAKVGTSFSDLLTNHLSQNATAGTIQPRVTLGGWWGGDGTAAVQPELDFNAMGMQSTGNASDLAISGNAFFMVQGQNGSTEFTRAGNFHFAPTGSKWTLVTADGHPVLDANGQAITVTEPLQISIAADGTVTEAGQAVARLGLAQIPLANQFLLPSSGTLYQLAPSGTYQVLANPQNAGVSVHSGYLATSNVDLSQEMADMLQAQNLYEANARALALSNQMMTTADKTRA